MTKVLLSSILSGILVFSSLSAVSAGNDKSGDYLGGMDISADTINAYKEYSSNFSELQSNYGNLSETNSSAGYQSYLKTIQENEESTQLNAKLSAIKDGKYNILTKEYVTNTLEDTGKSISNEKKNESLSSLADISLGNNEKVKDDTSEDEKDDVNPFLDNEVLDSTFGSNYKKSASDNQSEYNESNQNGISKSNDLTNDYNNYANSYAAIKNAISSEAASISSNANSASSSANSIASSNAAKNSSKKYSSAVSALQNNSLSNSANSLMSNSSVYKTSSALIEQMKQEYNNMQCTGIACASGATSALTGGKKILEGK